MPHSIAVSSSLQRVCIYTSTAVDQDLAALPTGLWASSLRQLWVSYTPLLLSAELLAAADRLEHVFIMNASASKLASITEQSEQAFWDWAAVHPPLQSLQFLRCEKLPFSFVSSLLALKNARPQLRVHCATYDDRLLADTFFPEM